MTNRHVPPGGVAPCRDGVGVDDLLQHVPSCRCRYTSGVDAAFAGRAAAPVLAVDAREAHEMADGRRDVDVRAARLVIGARADAGSGEGERRARLDDVERAVLPGCRPKA